MSVNDMFVHPDELDDEIEFSSTDSELEIFDNDQINNSRTVSTPSEFSDINRDSFSSTNYMQDNFLLNDDEKFDYYYCNIVMEGRYLYFLFLYEKIYENNLTPPVYMDRFYSNLKSNVCENKEVLQKLTDRFEYSAQRQWVRDQAQQILLNRLDFYSFTQKLKTLFQGARISWEKILVIYSFCTDLSIRALLQNYEKQFERIQNWTLFFLDSYVTDWVRSEGGWDVVLNQSLTFAAKIAILSFCCLGIIVLGIYIRNNSQK